MNKSLQEYTSDFLPRDTSYAKQKIKRPFWEFSKCWWIVCLYYSKMDKMYYSL